jgi:hypothetical protein
VLDYIWRNRLQTKPLWRNEESVNRGSVLGLRLNRVALQYVKIAQTREDFTTDGTDGTDEVHRVRGSFQSVKSVMLSRKVLFF